MYSVITDIGEIEQLAAELERKLSRHFTRQEQRKVNWPRGKSMPGQSPPNEPNVRFEKSKEALVRAWSPRYEPAMEPRKLRNFLMFGEPGTTSALNISVQLNFPLGSFHMGNGGVFLRAEDGQIWIAHTGKLTRITQLPRESVLSRFQGSTMMAEGHRRRPQEFILITRLRGRSTIDDLWNFAARARDVAEEAHQERLNGQTTHGANREGRATRGGTSGSAQGKKPSVRVQRMLGKLKKYVKEHSGKGWRKAVEAGTRTVEHGDVVHALVDLLGGAQEVQNSDFVDLAYATEEGIELFEVKTSVGTQVLYTAIGQLVVHSVAVGRATGEKIRRNLVVPAEPPSEFAEILRSEVNTRIITFRKRRGKYVFRGIEDQRG